MSAQIDTQKKKQAAVTKALENPYATLRALGYQPSLFEFIQLFWSEVSGDPPVYNWHIEYLCKELEQLAEGVAQGRPKDHDLIINIPPGTTKTITCSIMFPIWCWTKWYWMDFICASYSSGLSHTSAMKSRDIMRSDKFQKMYPEIGIKKDREAASHFQIYKRFKLNGKTKVKFGGMRYSTSVGATLTGFHGHILIVDDPLNPEQAASERELENCNRWMEQTLPSRKKNKEVAPTLLVMQRLHQNDPTGRWVEKNKKNLRHICLPGQIREYGTFLKPPELKQYYKDDLLDPVRMPWSVLEEMEIDFGQYGFAGQVGQNPTPPGGGMFKVDRMAVIHALPSEVNIEKTVRYWDKAGSADAGAYTAGVLMSRMKNGKYVIHDVVRGRWSAEDREAVILSTTQADNELRFTRVGIEQEGGSGGKESAEATIRMLAGFAVTADRPTGEKEVRADPVSVQCNNGNIILIKGDWNKPFKDELEMFPNSTFKDQVDALSGAFKMLTGKRMARTIR